MRRRPVAFHQARTEEPVVAARGTRVWGRLLRSMFVVCALVLLSSALILCRSALHRDLSVVRHYHPPGVQPVQDGSHLRVMAYNIAPGRGSRSFSGRGELHRVFSHSSRQDVLDSLRQVAAVIREADAGVSCPQRRGCPQHEQLDLDFVEVLRSELSGAYPYAAHDTKWLFCLPFYQHHTGNTILSKCPLEEAKNIDLGEGASTLSGAVTRHLQPRSDSHRRPSPWSPRIWSRRTTHSESSAPRPHTERGSPVG